MTNFTLEKWLEKHMISFGVTSLIGMLLFIVVVIYACYVHYDFKTHKILILVFNMLSVVILAGYD